MHYSCFNLHAVSLVSLHPSVSLVLPHLFVPLHNAKGALQLLQVVSQAVALGLQPVALGVQLGGGDFFLLQPLIQTRHLSLQLTPRHRQLNTPLLRLLQALLLLGRGKDRRESKERREDGGEKGGRVEYDE